MKNKSKDILFMCQFFYPEYVSSATLPFDTAQYLAKSGYSVGALCGYPKEYNAEGEIAEREVVDGIEIHRVNYIQAGRKKAMGRVVNYFSFVVAMLLHIKEVKDYKTLIIYSNPPLLPIVAMLCKLLFKTQIVFVSYDVYPELAIQTKAITKDGLTAKFFRAMNSVFFKKVDKVIVLSDDMKQFIVKNRNVSENKVVVIPNWYEDCKKKDISESKVIENIPDDAFVLSYLGNLGICQDAQILIDLAQKLKVDTDVHFIIAGHGNKMEWLKEQVRDNALKNMHVFPFLHGEDYETVLGRSNMFIVTLQPALWGLCSPSKTCAYLMAGKPVVVAMDEEIEIARDIVRSNAGVLLEGNKLDQICERIISIKLAKNQTEMMGENARKLFLQKYEKEVCLQQYEAFFNSL